LPAVISLEAKRLSFWDGGSISEVNERKQENLEETIEEK
jgi:Holliday junction resolvase-like predicted endonuclease